MPKIRTTLEARVRRHRRLRQRILGTPLRPRLCVFRSLKHIYAQVVEDSEGRTLAAASTGDPEIRLQLNGLPKVAQASLVGQLVARRALGLGVQSVVFDRGGNPYHGRVRALAEGAREEGLNF